MATTTNYGWDTPDDTDLVKDGAAAIRTLGSSADTTVKNLNPGTTAGDIDYYTSGTAKARIAIGSAGQVLQVNSGATAPEWAAPASGVAMAAGVNKIINGNMNVAQRNVSATPVWDSTTTYPNNDDAYIMDRFYLLSDGNDAVDVTVQNDAPVAAAGKSCRLDVETTNKKFGIAQIIENDMASPLIGQTVTLSFAAKVSSTTKLDNVKCAIVAWSGTANSLTSDIISAWEAEGTNPTLIANATYENSPANLNVTTSWATYTVSAAVDTASTNNLIVFIWSDVTDTTAGDFLYITNVQLERGSTASPFSLATGSQATESVACQRYFLATYADGVLCGFGKRNNATTLSYAVNTTAVMRAAPTIVYDSTANAQGGGTAFTLSAPAVSGKMSETYLNILATISAEPASAEAFVIVATRHGISAEL